MKLVRFSYTAITGWELRDIYLYGLNLIVGKNSTGKSRLLLILYAFKKMISQTSPIYHGKFEFEFLNKANERINYIIDRKNKDELFEELKINGNTILYRDTLGARLTSTRNGEKLNIHPPNDKLVLHVRRDIYDHPHFEQLIKWAENIHYFRFGHVHVGSFLSEGIVSSELENAKNIVEVYRKLSDESQKLLISELNEIGFSITSILSKEKEDKEIYVREADIESEIKQSQLSQGMFRSISVLIFLNFLAQDEDVSLLLVDDLCEGLDYDRSSKLSKLIFRKLSSSSSYQLVATTNDYFLMESVDLEHWNVLKRKGSVVTSTSHHQDAKLFREFKFTGLSNFDFFSSDYIDKNSR